MMGFLKGPLPCHKYLIFEIFHWLDFQKIGPQCTTKKIWRKILDLELTTSLTHLRSQFLVSFSSNLRQLQENRVGIIGDPLSQLSPNCAAKNIFLFKTEELMCLSPTNVIVPVFYYFDKKSTVLNKILAHNVWK